MCESLNKGVQAVHDGVTNSSVTANCTVSEDCLTVQCIVRILFLEFLVTTTYNPCDTPYSFRLQVVYPQNVEPLVNEVISESKVVSFTFGGNTGRIAVTVAQECSGITYSVSHTNLNVLYHNSRQLYINVCTGTGPVPTMHRAKCIHMYYVL